MVSVRHVMLSPITLQAQSLRGPQGLSQTGREGQDYRLCVTCAQRGE